MPPGCASAPPAIVSAASPASVEVIFPSRAIVLISEQTLVGSRTHVLRRSSECIKADTFTIPRGFNASLTLAAHDGITRPEIWSGSGMRAARLVLIRRLVSVGG